MLLIFGGGGIAQGIANVWDGTVHLCEKHECDVTDLRQVNDAVRRHEPDYAVNCAGVSYPSGAPICYEEELRVNLLGAIHVAANTITIPTVMIASVAGLYGKPGHVGYSASKAGVISVVQSLALEGRRIWAVSPGRVDTPMRERDYPNDTPGSRLTPEQVGQVVVDCLTTSKYRPGTNVVIRKEGLDRTLIEKHRGDGWRARLRVGEPVTI